MMTKVITKKEYHFDNSKECDEHMDLSKRMGYKILEYGSENDWYYTCEMENGNCDRIKKVKC